MRTRTRTRARETDCDRVRERKKADRESDGKHDRLGECSACDLQQAQHTTPPWLLSSQALKLGWGGGACPAVKTRTHQVAGDVAEEQQKAGLESACPGLLTQASSSSTQPEGPSRLSLVMINIGGRQGALPSRSPAPERRLCGYCTIAALGSGQTRSLDSRQGKRNFR